MSHIHTHTQKKTQTKTKSTRNWLEIGFILDVFKIILKCFSKQYCFCVQQILVYLFNNLLKSCKYIFSFITPGITLGFIFQQ